ncbi:MAG: hypothetical protein JNK02_00080 [Planctomycetes bacterium]|nr:hypothetical protein [Planctomycetota bacterium]
MRLLLAALAVPLTLFPLAAPQKPGAQPASPVTPQMLAPIEQVARQLAKGGREVEANDLLTALEKLGFPQANLDKLAKACKDDLGKAKSVIDSLPAGAKQLRTTSKQLAAVMGKLEGDAQAELARNILRLDGEAEAAHKVLGHEKVGRNWVPAEQKELRERRGKILEQIQASKKLEVPLVMGQVDDPVIQAACKTKATFARYGPFEVRTNFSQEKTARILRETMRAWALSNYLMSGTLKLPSAREGQPITGLWALIDSREQYKAFAAECAKNGEVREQVAAMIDNLNGFDHKSGTYVMLGQWEAECQAAILVQTWPWPRDGVMAPLAAGHLNWLSLTCFGTLLPGHTVGESKTALQGTTKVEESEDEKREREERLRLAKAGIAGSRSWMAFLAERGQDPPIANSFVDQLGMLTGDDLHKWTSIVDYLQEADLLSPAFKTLRRSKDAHVYQRYADALGFGVGELEARWRRWILGVRPGVAERIDKENLNAWPKEALAVLEYMNEIRENAFKGRVEGLWKLKFDPELSESCALHAHYLTLHPEQKKWPDAHEEYADKEAYTVEGAWAGLHSVIVWGNVRDYIDAIDGWMGTFYHRLPLVDPGLLRIGWGWEGEFVVMDTGSLAAPYDKPFVVVWPYDGQKDVPVHFFGDEHPDPIPGDTPGSVIEQNILGYPVTLQTNPFDENGVVDVVLELFEAKTKTKVDCHFSTPSEPTNPELAPPGAWCLMPKGHLKPNTEYRVTAEWKKGSLQTKTGVQKRMEWTFRTK